MGFLNRQASFQQHRRLSRGYVSNRHGRRHTSMMVFMLCITIGIASFGYYAAMIQIGSLFPSTHQLDLLSDQVVSKTSTIRNFALPSLVSWTSPEMIDCRNFENLEFGDEIFVETNQGFKMNIYNPDLDTVSNGIANEGSWEPHLLEGMHAALDKYPDAYFLDIGGNIGMWTLSVAALNKQTFTIEPSFLNYLKFCKSVNKNSFHDRVHLLSIAASEKAEYFTLHTPPKNYGGTAVRKFDREKDGENPMRKPIKGVPIDDLGLPTDRPVVIKLDVEGHELSALQGAIDFLQDADIVHINMELRCDVREEHRGEWDKIFNIFASKGLEPFQVDKKSETHLKAEDVSSLKCVEGVRYYDVAWRK